MYTIKTTQVQTLSWWFLFIFPLHSSLDLGSFYIRNIITTRSFASFCFYYSKNYFAAITYIDRKTRAPKDQMIKTILYIIKKHQKLEITSLHPPPDPRTALKPPMYHPLLLQGGVGPAKAGPTRTVGLCYIHMISYVHTGVRSLHIHFSSKKKVWDRASFFGGEIKLLGWPPSHHSTRF